VTGRLPLAAKQMPSELVIIVVGPMLVETAAISGRPSSKFSPSPMPEELPLVPFGIECREEE
jgi:hypothetical protein